MYERHFRLLLSKSIAIPKSLHGIVRGRKPVFRLQKSVLLW
jgi:hypothetical protein